MQREIRGAEGASVPTNTLGNCQRWDWMGKLALLCRQWEGRVVWLGRGIVDALAAFGVWGVLMETEPAEDSRSLPIRSGHLALFQRPGWCQPLLWEEGNP